MRANEKIKILTIIMDRSLAEIRQMRSADIPQIEGTPAYEAYSHMVLALTRHQNLLKRLYTYMQTNEDIRIAVAKLKDLSANAAQARSIMSYFTGLSASAMENVRKEHAQLQALMNQAEETEKVLNEPVDMIAEMTKPVSMEVMEEMLLPLLQNPSISAQSTHSAPSNPPSISNTQRPPHPPPAAPPPAAALVVQPVSRRQATSGKVFHSVVPG